MRVAKAASTISLDETTRAEPRHEVAHDEDDDLRQPSDEDTMNGLTCRPRGLAIIPNDRAPPVGPDDASPLAGISSWLMRPRAHAAPAPSSVVTG